MTARRLWRMGLDKPAAALLKRLTTREIQMPEGVENIKVEQTLPTEYAEPAEIVESLKAAPPRSSAIPELREAVDRASTALTQAFHPGYAAACRVASYLFHAITLNEYGGYSADALGFLAATCLWLMVATRRTSSEIGRKAYGFGGSTRQQVAQGILDYRFQRAMLCRRQQLGLAQKIVGEQDCGSHA